MVDKGGRAVNALDGGDGSDGCRRGGAPGQQLARSSSTTMSRARSTCPPAMVRPPVGDKPAPVSGEPSGQALGGHDGLVPFTVPPCGRDKTFIRP